MPASGGLVILDTLGICWRTQAANLKQNGCFNLFGSGLSGLGNKGADIAELILHRFHDRLNGIGFNSQALPGQFVQRRDFIVPPVSHIQRPA